MTFFRYIGALSVALLLANPALAQQGQGRQNTQTMQEQRVQELIETLEITPGQEPEFRAAMAQIRQQQMATMRENTGQRGQARGQRQGQMTREQRQEQMAERRGQAQQRRAEAGERREQAQTMAAQRQEATEEILSEVLTEEQMARFRAQQRR